MTKKCKNCNCDCHCDGDIHGDVYGACTCENCKCREVKEIITAEPEKIQCNTHSRFKKSCPICIEAAK